jgi:replicative DNA helicase
MGKMTTPPANIFAEQNLLSAMLCNPDRATPAASGLSSAAFADPLCSAIFDAVQSLHRAGSVIDSATISAFPQLRDWDTSALGDFLGTLYAANRPAENAASYVEIIVEAARRRESAEAGQRLYREAMNGNPLDDASDLLSRTTEALAEIRQRYGAMDLHTLHASSLIRQAVEAAELRALTEGPTGITSGIPSIDTIMGGWTPGALTTIGGRPAMGKSTILSCFALAACREGKKVLYFGTEMRGFQTIGRFICNAASIDASRWRSGRLNAEEARRLADCERHAETLNLQVNDKPDATPGFIQDVALRVRDEWDGLDMIVVDYLQRLSGDSKTRQADRRIEIGQMIKSLKNTALRLNVPLLTASQIGRHVERREDKRPMMSDLMESGDIEAESDNIALLYRPAYYAKPEEGGIKESGTEEEAEFIVGKQREGATGTVKVLYQPRYSRFAELPASTTQEGMF